MNERVEVEDFPVDELHPHPLNEKLYPADEAEDAELEKSIMENGVLEPLVATPADRAIISGTRRWRIAKKLGVKAVRVEFREFDDPEVAIVEYNRYRKKTPRIIKNEYDLIKQKLAPKAQERQEATQLAGKGESGEPVTKAEKFGVATGSKTEEESIHVRKEAAKSVGVSEEHLRRIDYVYDHEFLPPIKPLVEQLDHGEITVKEAYEKVKKIVEPSEKPEPEPLQLQPWICDVCLGQQSPYSAPVTVEMCPGCRVKFTVWKAEKDYAEFTKKK